METLPVIWWRSQVGVYREGPSAEEFVKEITNQDEYQIALAAMRALTSEDREMTMEECEEYDQLLEVIENYEWEHSREPFR